MDFGAIASIGSSLLGGFGGGGTSANKQFNIWRQQARYSNELQKEYDSEAIQRRVKDAKLAGVSPMAALGMTPSGGSASIGGGIDYTATGDDNSIGQNVGRAVAAAADPMTRLNMRLINSQIDGQDLDNEYKRSQIARMRGQIGPAMPGISSGAADDGQSTPMYTTVMTPSGPRRMVSPDYGQVLENDLTEYLRYIPRDFVNRSSRFFGETGRLISKYARNATRAFSRQ